MITNYQQVLREYVVGKDTPPQKKADDLNLLEMIFSEEMSIEGMVDAIANGPIPKVYEVKS